MKFSGNKLTLHLSIIFFIILLFTLVFFGLSVKKSQDLRSNNELSLILDDQLLIVEHLITNVLEQGNYDLQTIINQANLVKFLKTKKYSKLFKIFNNFVEYNPHYYSVDLFSNNSKLVASNSLPIFKNFTSQMSYKIILNDEFNIMRSLSNPFYGPYYSSFYGSHLISIHSKLYNKKDEFIGILRLLLPISHLFKNIESIDLNTHDNNINHDHPTLQIISKSNNFIYYHSDKRKMYVQAKGTRPASEDVKTRKIKIGSKSLNLEVQLSKKRVVSRPTFKNIIAIIKNNCLNLTLSIFLATLIFWIILIIKYKPLTFLLTRLTYILHHQRYDKKFEILKKDDFGQIMSQLNAMMEIAQHHKENEVILNLAKKEFQSYFNFLFNNAHDAALILEDGRLKQTNNIFLKIFNIPSDKNFLNINLVSLSPKFQPGHINSETLYQELYQNSINNPLSKSPWTFKKNNGDKITCILYIKTFSFTNNKHTSLVLIKNISLKDRTKQEFEINNTILNSIESTNHIGHWEWDFPNNSYKYSKEIYNLFELDNTLPNKNITQLIHESTHPKFKREIIKNQKNFLINGIAKDIDFKITTPKGSIKWIRSSAPNIIEYDRTGAPMKAIGTYQDVSLDIDYTKIKDSYQQLLTEHTEGRSNLLSSLSHEIRTPLNGISEMIEFINETPLSPEQQEYLEIAKIASTTLLNVTNNIIDISQIISNKLSLTELVFSLDDMIKNIQESVFFKDHKIFLKYNIQNNVPDLLYSDPAQITKVIENLATCFTRNIEAKDLHLDIHCLKQSIGNLKLKFTLTTPNEKTEECQEKEVRFQDLSDESSTSDFINFKCSSLDYKVAKRTIVFFDGVMSPMESIDSHSSFWFTLKLKQASETDKISPIKNKIIINHLHSSNILTTEEMSNFAILLAEDNTINQIIIFKLLEKIGFKNIIIAKNGKKALELYQNNKIDLILMDCIMPIMDGYQATQNIRRLEREQGDKIPIIAITANALDGDRQKCLESGMSGYIAKPVSKNDLDHNIAKIIDKYKNKTGPS